MTILYVCALLFPAPFAPPPAALSAPAPGVTVRLGDASLEEYTQGDPGNRILLLRGSRIAAK